MTDQWRLTGGIRYTYDESKSSSTSITNLYPNFGGPPTPICTSIETGITGVVASPEECRLHHSQYSHAPTWLLGLDYLPSDNAMLYAKYARGYRQGSVTPVAAEGFNTFKPEEVDSYEVGTKLSFNGVMPVTFNLSAFYNDFTKQQLQIVFFGPSVATQAGIVNAGSSRIYGTELQTTVSPFHGLVLDAAWTWLDSKLKAITEPTLVAGSPYTGFTLSSVEGDVLPLTPKQKVTLSATYTLPLSQEIGEISIGANFVYTSRMLVNNGGPFSTIQPTNLLNMNVAWKNIAGHPVDVTLFATNLTDREYYSYAGGLYNQAGFDYGTLSEPRMYGARVRVNFGD